MHISKIARDIEPSLARKLFNMAKDFDDVIDLTLGDPDLSPPAEIGEAAYKAIKNNLMHYSANAGLISARKAIASRIKKKWNVNCDENSNIIVTVGGMQALYLSMLSMINPGDEVIVFAPYYANYVQMITMCGGTPIIINAYNNDCGFNITKEMLQNAISTRTIAIIPTVLVFAYVGIRMKKKEMQAETGSKKVNMKKVIPWFILGFLALAILNSLSLIPTVVSAPMKSASKFLMVTALAAIGLSTSITDFKKAGLKPMFYGITIDTLVTLTALAVIWFMGLI